MRANTRPNSDVSAAVPSGSASVIRNLIWVYFVLLIIEGALRKWILPGFSNQLLLVRDPVLLLIYAVALASGLFVFNGIVTALGILGVLSVILGMLFGTGNVLVTGYGFDACFLHLPLIFIIPLVMNRDDVIKMGRWFMYLTIPAAILMIIQFRASPDDWINCGAGGTSGSQIRGALGKIRPPAFFSFITGAAQFLAIATAFVTYGFLRLNTYPRPALLIATFCVVIAAVVSTSRLALGGIGLVLMMIGVIFFLNSQSVAGIVRLIAPAGLVLLVATNLDIFKEGRVVFEARLTDAGDVGAGLTGTASNWTTRFFGDFILGFQAMEYAPILGRGLGLGTNVGARLLTGEVGFLAAEGEWARVIIEMGPILGLAYLVVRVLIAITLLRTSIRRVREGNFLPMLLFGASVLLVLSGQFSQATSLGFAVLISGLCLAAARMPAGATQIGFESSRVEIATSKKFRGRAVHAEALHAAAEPPTPVPPDSAKAKP
jgi:hypothetical protein